MKKMKKALFTLIAIGMCAACMFGSLGVYAAEDGANNNGLIIDIDFDKLEDKAGSSKESVAIHTRTNGNAPIRQDGTLYSNGNDCGIDVFLTPSNADVATLTSEMTVFARVYFSLDTTGGNNSGFASVYHFQDQSYRLFVRNPGAANSPVGARISDSSTSFIIDTEASEIGKRVKYTLDGEPLCTTIAQTVSITGGKMTSTIYISNDNGKNFEKVTSQEIDRGTKGLFNSDGEIKLCLYPEVNTKSGMKYETFRIYNKSLDESELVSVSAEFAPQTEPDTPDNTENNGQDGNGNTYDNGVTDNTPTAPDTATDTQPDIGTDKQTDTETAETENNEGCGSHLGAASVVTVFVAVTASAFIRRKKESESE